MDRPELETRKRVYDLVVQNPGVHLREIERLSSLPLGVVRYHLERLQREELIFAKEDRYFKRFFPKGKIPSVSTETFSVLRQERLRTIVLHLLNQPGETHSGLMSSMAVPASTLSTYLSILLKKGVIRRERKGRESLYFVADEESVMKVLIVYRPSFLDTLVDHAISLYLERN
ncbi:MAG TPA: BlaI/MecI/CopY family transcriptional regulator [Thermoplasmata archaeon]